MQITIQSLEITYNEVPYRFIVKKVFNTSRNKISFHCWAPDDNQSSRELINNEVLLFEWDQHIQDLVHPAHNPVARDICQAIKSSFALERA